MEILLIVDAVDMIYSARIVVHRFWAGIMDVVRELYSKLYTNM